ncbi:E3 ubiquitin-protein ligase TRIM69-like [Rhinoraja longicauda]
MFSHLGPKRPPLSLSCDPWFWTPPTSGTIFPQRTDIKQQQHQHQRNSCSVHAFTTNKDRVKSSIQSLTKYKSEIQQMEQQQKEKISGVLEQSHNLQSKITSQFAELHQILTGKEQRVLADIREEEKKILNTMEKKLEEIEENLNSIEEDLLKLQQQMDQQDGVVFLKLKDIVEAQFITSC